MGLIFEAPESARPTVLFETPDKWATSIIVGKALFELFTELRLHPNNCTCGNVTTDHTHSNTFLSSPIFENFRYRQGLLLLLRLPLAGTSSGHRIGLAEIEQV